MGRRFPESRQMPRPTATDPNASWGHDTEYGAVSPALICPVSRVSPVFGSSNQMCPVSRNSVCPPTGRTARLPGGFFSVHVWTLALTEGAETLAIPCSGDRQRQGRESVGCSGQAQPRTREARSGRVHVFDLSGPRKIPSVPRPRIRADRRPAQHMRIIRFATGDNCVQAATVLDAFVHEGTPIACSDITPRAILSGRIPGDGIAETDPLASPGALDCRTMSICGPKKPEGNRIPGISDLSGPGMPGKSG